MSTSVMLIEPLRTVSSAVVTGPEVATGASLTGVTVTSMTTVSVNPASSVATIEKLSEPEKSAFGV